MFKSNNSDTYIVFGEVQIEDMRARAQQAAAQQLAAEAAAKAEETEANAPSTAAAAESAAAAEDDDEEVDATGIEEKDIDLVVSQANVSRNKAVKALKNNNNDIVNAIMVSFLLDIPWLKSMHVYLLYGFIGIDYVKKYNVAINKDFFVVNRIYNLKQQQPCAAMM